MSKRLPELLHQRTLLQEHLAWLEREIAAEQSHSAVPPAPLPNSLPLAETSLRDVRPASPIATPAPTPPPFPGLPADLEKVVEQYRQDPGTLTQDTRRGCLIIFWVALGSTLLIAGIVYWLYAHHLGRWW